MDEHSHSSHALNDCEKLRAKVLEFIDGELDEESYSSLSVHIERCSHCGKRVVFESAFLSSVARCSGSWNLPPELTARLNALLNHAAAPPSSSARSEES